MLVQEMEPLPMLPLWHMELFPIRAH